MPKIRGPNPIVEIAANVVWPAIHAAGKHAGTGKKDRIDLKGLGFEPKEVRGLATLIQRHLTDSGWSIKPAAFKSIDLTTTVSDLADLLAKHAMVLGPKKCANGHGQSFPGQTTCNLDGLPFR